MLLLQVGLLIIIQGRSSQHSYMFTHFIPPSDYSHWYPLDDDNPLGECPAVEVWNYRSPQGTFGMSPKPRLDHPKEVKWRIGQVVRHHNFGYKGVIIGWDLKAKVRTP